MHVRSTIKLIWHLYGCFCDAIIASDDTLSIQFKANIPIHLCLHCNYAMDSSSSQLNCAICYYIENYTITNGKVFFSENDTFVSWNKNSLAIKEDVAKKSTVNITHIARLVTTRNDIRIWPRIMLSWALYVRSLYCYC